MNKQILIIGGGTTFTRQSDYIHSLQTIEIDKTRLYPKLDWKQTIDQNLGKDYEVLIARMPSSDNAHFKYWRIYFERIIEVLDNQLILIGHSLGGIFLAKYLSENLLPKNIKALFLLAAPFEEDTLGESLGDFKLSSDFNLLNKQADTIYILHSEDDEVVPFADSFKYHAVLDNSEIIIFKDKGHFNQPDFPELLNLLRKI